MRLPRRIGKLHYLIIGIWLCSIILTVTLYTNLTSATEETKRSNIEANRNADADRRVGVDKQEDTSDLKLPRQPTEEVVAARQQPVQPLGEFRFDVKPDDPKRDWHDAAAIRRDKQRTGPGEQGLPVDPNRLNNKSEQDRLYAVNGFNAFVSDTIALDRSIPDIRHPLCSLAKYSARLPRVSVIIPFYDEHLSTLLRTVHSVINRSPPELLVEVILSDDGSTKDFLGHELEAYVKEHFALDQDDSRRTNRTVVLIVRAKKRAGLIRARLAGAQIARGDVLLFLDSHCEASVNWLPPLLEPIAMDYRVVTCPFIDVTDFDTFAYRAQDEGARGAFDWQFFYKRLPLTPEDLKRPAQPFDSPVMAGGLFAISKRWFDELGRYDPQLLIWGGEQYELSFKVWQCGGRVVDTPCSRVGHIYRKFSPFPTSSEFGDFASRNYKRVAEVWMDNWKEHLYKRMPGVRMANAGDLTEQLAVRQRLKCKSFDWFMKEVAFDLVQHYPPVEPEPFAKGPIRLISNNLCMDAQNGEAMHSIALARCGRGEQEFQITHRRDIRLTGGRNNWCLDVPQHQQDSSIVLYACHNSEGNQLFKYNLVTSQLYHPASSMCIDADVNQMRLRMMPCDNNAIGQQWQLQKSNREALEELWRYNVV